MFLTMSSSAVGSSTSALVQTQLAALQTRDQISTKVAVKAMDAQRAQGDAAIALLESAVQTAESVNARPGRLDVMA